MKHRFLLFIFFVAGTAAAQQQKKLLCSYTFSNKAALKDWKIEGEGMAFIKNGKLILEPTHFPMLRKLMEKGTISKKNDPAEYQPYVEQAMKKKYGNKMERYYGKDGQFLGGNFNIWNTKFPTGTDYAIEFDFKSLYPAPLQMMLFSAKGVSGKSIFDAGFPPRYGLATELMTGDIRNYRLSFFEPNRKTANLRKAPGRKLLYEAEDIVSKDASKTYHCEIRKKGSNISYRVDGKLIFAYTDADPLGDGHWGFRLMPCTVAEYDNVNVYQLY